jgi:hypothetical protein
MEELGGKSLFKSVPDWHECPILGSMLEHGKDMHATGEELYFLPVSWYLTKIRHKLPALTFIQESKYRTGIP